MYRNPRQFVDSRHWIIWIDLIHDTRHLCMRLRIDGILAMSRGFSTSNRGRICLFNQQKTAIFKILIQNVQFEFRQVLRHYYILNGHLRLLLLPDNLQ